MYAKFTSEIYNFTNAIESASLSKIFFWKNTTDQIQKPIIKNLQHH